MGLRRKAHPILEGSVSIEVKSEARHFLLETVSPIQEFAMDTEPLYADVPHEMGHLPEQIGTYLTFTVLLVPEKADGIMYTLKDLNVVDRNGNLLEVVNDEDAGQHSGDHSDGPDDHRDGKSDRSTD